MLLLHGLWMMLLVEVMGSELWGGWKLCWVRGLVGERLLHELRAVLLIVIIGNLMRGDWGLCRVRKLVGERLLHGLWVALLVVIMGKMLRGGWELCLVCWGWCSGHGIDIYCFVGDGGVETGKVW